MKKIELVGWGIIAISLILVSLSIPLGSVLGLLPATIGGVLILVGIKIIAMSESLKEKSIGNKE